MALLLVVDLGKLEAAVVPRKVTARANAATIDTHRLFINIFSSLCPGYGRLVTLPPGDNPLPIDSIVTFQNDLSIGPGWL